MLENLVLDILKVFDSKQNDDKAQKEKKQSKRSDPMIVASPFRFCEEIQKNSYCEDKI